MNKKEVKRIVSISAMGIYISAKS